MNEITWSQLIDMARSALKNRDLNGVYSQRLDYEIAEIDKQGANRYWEDVVNENKTFTTNTNGLLLPWLLGRLEGDANIDPIESREDPLVLTSRHSEIRRMVDEIGHLPFDIVQDDDKPDIDIDCLPQARDEIKAYAARRYGESNVASVGTWQTYLFKHALGDAFNALGLVKDTTVDDFVAVFGAEGAARHLKMGRTNDAASSTDTRRGSTADSTRTLAVAVSKDLPDDVNEMKNSGVGVCKGKVIGEDGVEKECKFEHTEVACQKCGSEDTETPTIGSLLNEHEILIRFHDRSPLHAKVLEVATRLVGCIRNQGKHAGAIIIADRDLFGNVPMQYDPKADQWVSIWTEGRNTQLSKFGYNKWDILGLKNLLYIYECCMKIEENHGISFGDGLSGLDDLDPEGDGRAGVYWKNNKKYNIPLHDDEALKLANEQRTDAVFQFDTDLAKSILANGVSSFWDLLIFNAMGHPGPMAMIPEYVNRRDDESQAWKKTEHKEILEVLGSTKGIVVYQEQLTDLWQRIAGFTGPEAQFARKAVAKKWADKLKPVRQKWIDGASPTLGKDKAIEWWDKRLAPFGRYAFNRSHAVSYCLWAYRCLWFKAHFPEEWWASVMGHCHQDKLERYMAAARADLVKFGEIDINRMTTRPAAHAGSNAHGGQNTVALGLISLKKIGDSIAEQFADDSSTIEEHRKAPKDGYTDIDHFIMIKGKNKTLLERLIKLGAFSKLHPNINATWMWYLHKYCTGEVSEGGKKIKITAMKERHRQQILENGGWTQQKVEEERKRQIEAWKQANPTKVRVPDKLLNWVKKADETRDAIMALYPNDFTLPEILEFEQEFLGYYWHSPTDLYHTGGDCTIEHAKMVGRLEGVIVKSEQNLTRNNSKYLRLKVTDGIKECLVLVWEQDMVNQDSKLTKVDVGVRMRVDYDDERNSFTLHRGSIIEPLWTKKGWDQMQEGMLPDEEVLVG
jgi:DNA polymerase III alpha subunit